MRPFISRWLVTSRFLLALPVVFGLAVAAEAQLPIDDLRRALQVGGVAEVGTPEALEFRRAKIKEIVDRMKTIGELRRALILDEWKVDPNRVINEGIRMVDLEMRKLVGDRLAQAIQTVAERGDVNARLAVANLIAEMGPAIRATEPVERAGYSRRLTPIVARLCEDKDLGVRQEAIRALGNINGTPKDVSDVFRKTLQKDTSVGPRRLAADGLQQMIKVISHLQKRGQTATGVEATRKDLFDALQAVAPVLAEAVGDTDSEVRMLALQGVQAAAQSLSDLMDVPEGAARRDFPPPGRKLTPVDRTRILEAYRQAEEELSQVRPLLMAYRQEVPRYARGLHDSEPRVRLAATQAFENLGYARLRLVRRAYALPTIKDLKDGIEKSPRELLAPVDFLEPTLGKDLEQVQVLLKDPDVRIRRSAAEVLQVLEERALPCLPGLIEALRDPDRFVRWTATKTIGTLPPEKATDAVLPLATVLSDTDLNLRIAAATSLEAMGAYAKDAVPGLGQAVRNGDVEARLAAMYALVRVGPEAARPAVPALIVALTSSDPRVLKAACEVLAYIGPSASEALPTLRRLIGHDDSDVRASASDAILSVLRIQDL